MYAISMLLFKGFDSKTAVKAEPCGSQSSHLAPSRCSPTELFSNEIAVDRSWIVAKTIYSIQTNLMVRR